MSEDVSIAEYRPTRFRERLVYQTHGKVDLHVDVFGDTSRQDEPKPAILCFHGGGWVAGDIRQFHPFCDRFVEYGWMAFCAQYRLAGKTVTPFDCVDDARHALTWLINHSQELGIRHEAIVLAGASAGGHLALCAAQQSLPQPIRPCAIVLWNPVLDTSEEGFGHDLIGCDWQRISPLHQIAKKMPPTLIFNGGADQTTPVCTLEKYQKEMSRNGNSCSIKVFPGMNHGFFNWGRNGHAYFEETCSAALAFSSEHRP